MVNPWLEWQRMVRAGTMLSETMTASQTVVGHRSKTIEAAMSDPMGADYVELGRMVSEKSTAFGAAGASLSRDWLAMQRDWNAQALALSSMMMGQAPGPRGAGDDCARAAAGQRGAGEQRPRNDPDPPRRHRQSKATGAQTLVVQTRIGMRT
ncbi:MAG: hypothetical protein LH610_03420 [Sphingomonas bacterium]|nr:hypothetical protein [Sphingomonas bacterium]